MEAKFKILSQPKPVYNSDIKRFHAINGTKILITCPNCGEEFIEELKGDCVSYPVINRPYEYHVNHSKEWEDGYGGWESFDHEFSILLYLKLQVLPYVEGMENE